MEDACIEDIHIEVLGKAFSFIETIPFMIHSSIQYSCGKQGIAMVKKLETQLGTHTVILNGDGSKYLKMTQGFIVILDDNWPSYLKIWESIRVPIVCIGSYKHIKEVKEIYPDKNIMYAHSSINPHRPILRILRKIHNDASLQYNTDYTRYNNIVTSYEIDGVEYFKGLCDIPHNGHPLEDQYDEVYSDVEYGEFEDGDIEENIEEEHLEDLIMVVKYVEPLCDMDTLRTLKDISVTLLRSKI